jgi:hypothetical protein
VIALHLPGPESAALIVAALLTAAETTTDLAEATRCRLLADQIGDGLDQLPASHVQPTGGPV